MSFEEADFYSCQADAEELFETDPDEAIEAHLDNVVDFRPLPEEITIYGWKKVALEPRRDCLVDLAIEPVLERLDEDYGDPEEATEPTEAMLAATRAFIDAVLADYKVWRCEPCGQQTVAVLPWVREHRLDWLEDEQ